MKCKYTARKAERVGKLRNSNAGILVFSACSLAIVQQMYVYDIHLVRSKGSLVRFMIFALLDLMQSIQQ